LYFIRLRRIPRLFKPWMNAVKSRGASVDSAPTACRRITPTSVAKLSERILPYLTSRGKPGTTGFSPWGSMAPDEEGKDTGKTNDEAWDQRKSCLGQRNERTRAMVERRGIAYESSVPDNLLQQTWISKPHDKTGELLKSL
jgi:hypothetical protein